LKGDKVIEEYPRSRFIKVKCNDCENVQVIFGCASSVIKCVVCGRTLATPTSGKTLVKTQIIEVLK